MLAKQAKAAAKSKVAIKSKAAAKAIKVLNQTRKCVLSRAYHIAYRTALKNGSLPAKAKEFATDAFRAAGVAYDNNND